MRARTRRFRSLPIVITISFAPIAARSSPAASSAILDEVVVTVIRSFREYAPLCLAVRRRGLCLGKGHRGSAWMVAGHTLPQHEASGDLAIWCFGDVRLFGDLC